MPDYAQIFDLLLAVAGVYMLYAAITGKGSIYKNVNVKAEKQDAYKKLIKWFCVVGGLISLVLVPLDYLHVEPASTVVFIVLCVLVVAVSAAVAAAGRLWR